jgi:cytochrome c553
MLRINILPPVPPVLTEAERARGIMAAAKADRQAVFKGDCASCHAKNTEGKYGPAAFRRRLRRLPRGENRATMVPDLHNLKVPTNEEFWRTWITSARPARSCRRSPPPQGGPLTDMQIASLAAYLNAAIPSHVASRTPARWGSGARICRTNPAGAGLNPEVRLRKNFPRRYPVNHDSETG